MKAADLAQEATRLLLLVKAEDEQAAEAYDRLLYEPLLEHVARRGHLLVSKASRLTGTDQMGVPFVGPADLEEVAHDVAVEALRAARRNVHQFQPGRGDGAAWAFRAASFAYVDVVRTRSGSRRKLQQVPTDHDELVAACDATAQDAGPAVRYEMQEALDRAVCAGVGRAQGPPAEEAVRVRLRRHRPDALRRPARRKAGRHAHQRRPAQDPPGGEALPRRTRGRVTLRAPGWTRTRTVAHSAALALEVKPQRAENTHSPTRPRRRPG